MTKMATVVADVDKKRVLCRISSESLRIKFGASDDKLMQSVVQHRVEIQDAANGLLSGMTTKRTDQFLSKLPTFSGN